MGTGKINGWDWNVERDRDMEGRGTRMVELIGALKTLKRTSPFKKIVETEPVVLPSGKTTLSPSNTTGKKDKRWRASTAMTSHCQGCFLMVGRMNKLEYCTRYMFNSTTNNRQTRE
eukprot:TRINITY_DN8105_c0_g1_i1.p2 TRINITY_DN8105_c0_g1~~TRINITY_DN8105_c0_g1_i1.p2  ORF type:complete len:116 (+),score=20.20 TRINITY_DN8105_c0_g1_i1:451-798(+)